MIITIYKTLLLELTFLSKQNFEKVMVCNNYYDILIICTQSYGHMYLIIFTKFYGFTYSYLMII